MGSVLDLMKPGAHVVSGNILATAQGGLVHVVAECLWRWEFYRQTGQKIEMATICVIFFLIEPTYSRRVKQSLGYERGCNRKLIIDAGCRLSVHCMSDLGLLRSLFTIDLYCLLGKPSQLLKFVSSLVKVYHD